MKRRYCLLISATLAFTPWLNSFGEIYKWTDENGNVVFSERKPRDEQLEVENVQPKTGRARGSSASEIEADEEASASAAAKAEERKRKELEVAEQNKKVEERNCKVSRDRLASLQRPRVNEVAEDGTRRVIGEDERQAEIAKAEAAVKEWCK